ncbi:PTS system mannose/fructose/N-acetylgalactosamine-transporter subunit IIB [Schleiferilactobacillus harbinensis]|uniref:PTS mannose/fructose/sorbose transporter subunit IIB n=1 Tax=Schleiferilactobacillus harbinensis TaxID=304207 RepID=A0A510TVV9_9LACO|nr:PTS sugar transporter subunit IIB [Schleiferilactobacillus harbinensis]MCI1687362.1 PTS sugar transporter subunit IIB [Schleiferilactobacillus harbinensis]MCI1783689.1 PTS sugar transporter subunit IIB [Schleiferilactobacillus harbinensis]MCI1851554.1 PTS sugar transporter subunit IIB [Schleiferilactobacillus harbinensis]QFR24679.1 PTS mannose/fructose/sorbose transporter subunit IIB [Schleiferilactobacillus harbinensis]GEK05610.1 PTS sorbose transporter subunit IIB [Schleiferilactobacillus
MIAMMRVDDRLIHGQVAVMWSKNLQVDRILVANDQIAGNEIQKSALLMAAPDGIKAAILPVEKAIGLANNPRAAKLRILLLVNNVTDLLRVVKEVPTEGVKVDIANVGRVAGDLENKKKITDTVYLTDEEIAQAKEVGQRAQNYVYQPLPGDSAIPFMSLLKED